MQQPFHHFLHENRYLQSSASNTSLKDFVRGVSEEENLTGAGLKGSTSFASVESASVFGDDGWTPSSHSAYRFNPFVDDEQEIDPLQQQIFIIKGFVTF